MNLYIRLLLLFIKCLWRSKLDMLDTSILRFHVLPNDLDLNMHMNNGRYLTIMDLGRFDLMIRCGLMQKAIKHKYAPVLGSVKIRYRIPLTPFQLYDVHTRIVCWDEKWAYIEQRFVIVSGKKKGAVAAIALLKASLYDTKKRQTILPQDVLNLIDHTGTSPEMPDYFKEWVKAEASLKSVTAAK